MGAEQQTEPAGSAEQRRKRSPVETSGARRAGGFRADGNGGAGGAPGACELVEPTSGSGRNCGWSLRSLLSLRTGRNGGTGGIVQLVETAGGVCRRAVPVDGGCRSLRNLRCRWVGCSCGVCSACGPVETASPGGGAQLVEAAGGVCRRAMPVDGGCRSSRNLRCGGSGVAAGTAGRRCVSVGIMSCVTRWRRSGGAG